MYEGNFLNWLSSVLGLFNMTLNRIMGLPALRLFAGVLVFLMYFCTGHTKRDGKG